VEAENQIAILTGACSNSSAPSYTGSTGNLMRAAHSFKGAARIVNLLAAVRLAHAMEDCFAWPSRGNWSWAGRPLTCSSAAWIGWGRLPNSTRRALSRGGGARR